MDRYLFKAKRVDNGEWVQGYYVKGLNMYDKEVYLIFEPNTMFYSSGETDGWYKVDPTTICRCTGLKDKNGKLIWERAPTEFMTQGGCSPTLSTMQGGNQEPKILEAKQLGFMDNGTGKHQSNTVYDENALCPNITTVEGGGTQQIKVCESQIVAMRGRNPDNPSDRTVGSQTEQRLEVNMQGTSNCLTSVQKDNLLLENVKIRQATRDGSIECEIGGCFDASYPNSKTRRDRVQDKGNTCPTLTAQNQEVVGIEKVGQISSNGSQCGTVISDNGISANLVAGTHGYANSHIATQYRIRKLTPRECGRLMGVSDEDIDKMAAVNSNTQLYKQFGNSIVVDVMCAMFKNLNIKQGDGNETLQTN